MTTTPDDDGQHDFDDDLPTLETRPPPIANEDVFPPTPPPDVDPNLPDTAPHRSMDYLAGRETGYREGVNAACAVLAPELRRAGVSEAEIPRIALRVRQGAEDRG